jgi:hypothetical protein
MQGEKVIVRAFEKEPLVRYIWAVFPDVIYICSEEGYQKLMAGEEWRPVGFPREDVFQYDPGNGDALSENWRHDPCFWEHLTRWKERE